jgi:hypothetical protein
MIENRGKIVARRAHSLYCGRIHTFFARKGYQLVRRSEFH